jgi:hypothetical protein
MQRKSSPRPGEISVSGCGCGKIGVFVICVGVPGQAQPDWRRKTCTNAAAGCLGSATWRRSESGRLSQRMDVHGEGLEEPKERIKFVAGRRGSLLETGVGWCGAGEAFPYLLAAVLARTRGSIIGPNKGSLSELLEIKVIAAFPRWL